MSENHTIGPWETSADATPDWHTQITVYAESSGDRVATVFSAADAALVASAPDLLAALRLVIDLSSYEENPEDWDGPAMHAVDDRAIAAALSAIDKAMSVKESA